MNVVFPVEYSTECAKTAMYCNFSVYSGGYWNISKIPLNPEAIYVAYFATSISVDITVIYYYL